MVKINNYEFGLITVNGKEFRQDVAVFWDGTVSEWQRAESHVIVPADIKFIFAKNPEAIVIGTGESGMAEVLAETKAEIISKGIKLTIEKTSAVVELFNDNADKGIRVVGLFHLTC